MILRLLLSTLFSVGGGTVAQASPAPDLSASFEECPVGEGNMGKVAPAIYSFDVESATARNVRGNLAVETDRGWYRVPFGPFALHEATRHFADGNGYSTTDTNFRSPIVYVSFGKPLTILNWWVERATADTSDWRAEGLFTCYPTVRPDPASPYIFHISSAEAAPYITMPPNTKPVRAAAVAPIERTDCGQPFADAAVDVAATPKYPFDSPMPLATSEIMVTILPSGQAAYADVFKSSGIVAFDIAARQAAMISTYKPKIAYCRPTVGDYLFKVTFDPK